MHLKSCLLTVLHFPIRRRVVLAASFLLVTSSAFGATAEPGALLDDFSDPEHTQLGGGRLLITDKDLGSQSQATKTCENGILRVEGELVPGRGVPAFISVPLLLSAEGTAQDLSAYQGVRLRVKVIQGMLSVQVSSTEIQNFDYHTSAPLAAKGGEFHEVRIPFKDLKRAWSEPIALNLKTITSVNLVAFGTGRERFAYELDEISFY